MAEPALQCLVKNKNVPTLSLYFWEYREHEIALAVVCQKPCDRPSQEKEMKKEIYKVYF